MTARQFRRRTGQPIRWNGGREPGRKEPVRRVIDGILTFALVAFTFSFLAAVPMRLIAGSWTSP